MSDFLVARNLPLPGLGLLVLPQVPAPDWLAAHPLYTALRLLLHRPGQSPLPVPATIEELAFAGEAPARALLLDADLGGEPGPNARLELLEVAAPDLLFGE